MSESSTTPLGKDELEQRWEDCDDCGYPHETPHRCEHHQRQWHWWREGALYGYTKATEHD